MNKRAFSHESLPSWMLATLALATISTPLGARAAEATYGTKTINSIAAYWGCIYGGGSVAYCNKQYDVADPMTVGVTGLTLSIQTDPSRYTFNPAGSGPLGVFSVGGDAPPAAPGIGTQPFQALPTSGFSPGAPLPGSTLIYTDVAGLLTVNYQLATPITLGSEVNYFILEFDLVHPVLIDFATSTVTYAPTGLGGDFTQTSAACTTVEPMGGCASDDPTSAITFNFSYVPEPAIWLTMTVGLGGMGAMLRARRGKEAPAG